MSWIEEDGLRRNKHGILLRKNQVHAPVLNVGDRFFDCGNGRWATLLRIRPDEGLHLLALGFRGRRGRAGAGRRRPASWEGR